MAFRRAFRLAPLLTLAVVGCTSPGPDVVGRQYLERVERGDRSGAYDLLAEGEIKAFTVWQFGELMRPLPPARKEIPYSPRFSITVLANGADGAKLSVEYFVPDYDALLKRLFADAEAAVLVRTKGIESGLAKVFPDGKVPSTVTTETLVMVKETAGWRVKPDLSNLRDTLALLDTASKHEAAGEFRQAVAVCDQALTTRPGYWPAAVFKKHVEERAAFLESPTK